MIPYTFFNDVEKRLKYVLYGDTDSIFVYVSKYKVDLNNLSGAIEMAKMISEEINRRVEEHLNSYVLPKLGINPKHNKTTFKTEIIANSIFFLGIKKNYAYRLIVKENVFIEKMPVKYAGLISKSDLTKYTRTMIQGMIENIMFGIKASPEEKRVAAVNYIVGFKNKVHDDIINLNISQVGQPKKWGTNSKKDDDTWQIYGMRLFNTVMNEAIFKPMGGGIAVPIIITNVTEFLERIAPFRFNNELFLNDAPITKLNYIVFPYVFSVETVKQKLEYFKIRIDEDTLWSKICGRNVQDIIELFNQYSNPINRLIIGE